MYYFLCSGRKSGEVCDASGMCSYVLLCPSPYRRPMVLLRSGCMYGLYMNATAWYGVIIINTFGAVDGRVWRCATATAMCSYVLLCPSPYRRPMVLLRSGCMYCWCMNMTGWYGDVIINTFGAVGGK